MDKPKPIAKNISNKINSPLDGSLANACTEVSSPDLTIKVPIREKEKAIIESNKTQLIK